MLLSFFVSYFIFFSILFYFHEVGKFLSRNLFKQNFKTYINIYLGFGIFISFINLIYLIGLRNFKYIIFSLIIHFFLLLFKNFKFLKFNLNIKFFFLIFLSIIFSLTVFNHQYTNHDDINGYFNIYSSIINDNYKFSPDSNMRAWLSSFGYNFIQSIFIFFGGFNSVYFFDQAFGCVLILIFFYELLQKKLTSIEFVFFFFFISLSCLSLSATSMPNVILFSLSLILLDQLKKFHEGSKNLLIITALFLVAYNLRFNYLISFISFLFIILFFLKIPTNSLFLKKQSKKIILIILIFLIPEFFHKFYIFKTISPILGSDFYITSNKFFQEINFINSNPPDLLNFWFKVFVKKHLIFILFLTSIVVLVKKNFSFYFIVLASYLLSSLIISYISLPDYWNPRRYLLPLENSLIFYLLINIWYYVTNLNNKYFVYLKVRNLYFITFAFMAINLSLASYKIDFFEKFYLNKIESIQNIFYPNKDIKKPFFYREKIFNEKTNKNYIDEFNNCLKEQKIEKDLLVLIKHAYLIKNIKVNIIDYKYGFVMSEKTYPIFQSFDIQAKYFNANYDKIIIEKDILFNDFEISTYIEEYEQRKKNNSFSLKNFYTTSKYDLYPLIAWFDLARFLNNFIIYKPDSIICNNQKFLLLKFN
jgi:hypothetical protein